MASLTAAAADRWQAAAVPTWLPRWGLTALWVCALGVAFVLDDTACTPLDPSVCGTAPFDAVVIALALAIPVLLWWLPRLGCALAVAFPALPVLAGDPWQTQGAFLLLAGASAAALVRYRRAREQQRAAIAAVAGGSPAAAPPVPDLPDVGDPRTAWNLLRVGGVGCALLAAVGMLLWSARLDRAEGEHLARAVEVDAQVVESDEVGDVTVTWTDPRSGSHVADLTVFDAEPYPVGAVVPLLVDPVDPTWARLVAEPLDRTGWFVGAFAALLLAGVWIGQELRTRWALQTLWLGMHPSLDVRVVAADGDVLVLTEDDEPLARFPIAGLVPDPDSPAGAAMLQLVEGDVADDVWEQEEREAFARAWRGEFDDELPVPATVVGAFEDGGWALLVVEEGAVVPAGPIRAVTETLPTGLTRWRSPVDIGPEEEARRARWEAVRRFVTREEAPDVPVEPLPALHLPALPVAYGPSSRSRALGLLLVIGAYLVGPAAMVFLAEGWYHRAVFGVLAGQALLAGVGRLAGRVHADRDRLEVVTGWRRHRIPWPSLLGVRRQQDRILLGVEPFEELRLPRLHAGARPDGGPAPDAGSVLAGLHEQYRWATGCGSVAREQVPIGWWLGGGLVVVLVATALAIATGMITPPAW